VKPVIYVRPRTAWRLVKVVAWFVVFSVLSAHRGPGAGVFVGVTVAWVVVRLWIRSRPPVMAPQVSPDDALRLLRALHYLRTVEADEEAPESPERIEARREP
jgi:hypothetical protein